MSTLPSSLEPAQDFAGAPAPADKPAEVEPAVCIRNLYHRFSPDPNVNPTLDDNNLTIEPGAMVVMTGPSGSGKTTLLTLIGGIRTVQQGSLRVLGREMCGLSSEQLMEVRRNIGFIFQAHNLFDALTARQNVRMALELKEGHSPAEMNRLADEILGKVDLGHRIHYKPGSLSGGQKQRVAIARALVNRPKLILADEPTAALDKESGRKVVDLLKGLARNEGCTILLVTHDSRILDVADRIVNMIDGKIVSQILVEEAVTIIEFLRKCPLFEHHTPAALTEISQKMKKEQYAPGSAIIREGDEGDKFFVIRDGEVEVRRTNPPRVLTLGQGEFFGETALLSGEPRNATVTARQEVLVYSLKKGDLLAALEKSASFKEQLLEAFKERR